MTDHEQQHMERAAWEALRREAKASMREALTGVVKFAQRVQDGDLLHMTQTLTDLIAKARAQYIAAEKWLADNPAPF